MYLWTYLPCTVLFTVLSEEAQSYGIVSPEQADNLIHEVRPDVGDGEDGKPADARPTA